MMYRRMGPKELEKVIEEVKSRKYGYDVLNWDVDNDLIFKGKAMASLVKHKSIPNHYHLKFEWRDEPTPEFFNIFNARENAKRIVLHHLNYDASEQP